MYAGKVIGVGEYKAHLITDNDFIEVFGKKAKTVSKVLPHNNRYSLIDLKSGNVFKTNTDMAYEAATKAIKMAGVKNNDIDMIIYSTLTPDYIIPTCYTILQDKLGIKTCKGFDIRSGCAGFGSAMVIAQQCIMTQMAQRVLVVGSEVLSSRYSMFFNDIGNFPIKALFNLMFFGDGAGAILLEATKEKNKGIFYADIESNKAHIGYGSIIEIGGSKYPYPTEQISKERWPIYQPSKLSDEYLPLVLIDAIDEFLKKTGMSLRDIDHFILPVETEKMARQIINHFEEFDINKVISAGREGGALANAAVPMSICKGVEDGTIKVNDKLLIYAAENTKWQHAVMGLTW